MKKLLVLILILCVCLFCFVGCTDDNDDNLTLVKLNEVTHSVFYAPLYVAINNGFFEEEGLKIELTNGGGADKSMAALLSKQSDIGLMGPEASVYIKLEGSTNYPVVFGQLTKRDGSFLISRRDEPNFKFADLKGKEIIGGRKSGMPAMSLEYALKNNNLVKDVDVKINYDVQFDLIVAAFESGIGDYCTMFEPAASAYVEAGKGHIVASIGEHAGLMPYTCFMATKNYITDNTDTVKKFMRAVMKGINFVKDSSNADIAEALLSSFPATSKGLLEKSVKSYKDVDAFMTSPYLDEANFNNMIDLLLFTKAISSKVAYADIIDNSLVNSL